ncbi:MAG: hypothetical protein JWO11_2677 [Nocardioides sp.]|nr:hypothetical protein [Nocardioides sp.]
MMVTLVARYPCNPCGYRLKALLLPSMRINKRSMRSVGTSIGVTDRICPECGTSTPPTDRLAYRLTPDSAAQVSAYRLRRWPELAKELTS